MADEIESFSAMLRLALGNRLDANAAGFVEMLAEDGVMEFPYAPVGHPKRLQGREAIATHLAMVSRLIAFESMGTPIVHNTPDPDLTILEFSASGRGVETGAPYEQRYISLIHTKRGRIVLFRDYWDPLTLLSATKSSPVGDAFTLEGAPHV